MHNAHRLTDHRNKFMNDSNVNKDLKRAGLRTTHPRIKVLEILEKSDTRHMAAEDIYKVLLEQGESIGLATVYRALTQFESAGLVVRHNFESDRAVYELNDDEHHDHLICIKCNKVVEFFNADIESLQDKVAQLNNFSLVDHSLTLYGMCEDCQSKK